MSERTRTGWVYVLTNPSIPHQVKIGFTSAHPEERANQLRGTHLATSFRVETAFLFVDNAYAIEQRTHKFLKDLRVASNREFFHCSPQDAAYAILKASTSLNETVAAISPVLLNDEEIEERKRIEEEQKRREFALKAPCQRLVWTQIYYPFKDHHGAPYTIFYNSPGGPTARESWKLLIWCFTDCNCKKCKETRNIKYNNPRDFKFTFFQCFYDGKCSEYDRWLSFDDYGRYMYMEASRKIVRDSELLSREEMDLVKFGDAPYIGVSWCIKRGSWRSETNGTTFIESVFEGKHFETSYFDCKEDAISHFRKRHKPDKDFGGAISKYYCPCSKCKETYLNKQRLVNEKANL